MIRSLGVDGCPGGWVAVELCDGSFAQAVVRPSFADVLNAFPESVAVGVDIPIGLPEGGQRAADKAAREFVGVRRSSVFPTPTRQMLESPWKPGLGVTRQTHSLGTRILEVELALKESAMRDRIYEVHPEVSFAAMKGRPLTKPKTSWNGLQRRLSLLRATGIELPDNLPSVGVVPGDDLLDAAAAAWSAHRIARGKAATLPVKPPADSQGRPVAIWY